MNQDGETKDFFNILKARDPALASRVEAIREKGLEDWVHLLVPELGSHAGIPHLRNVERIANKIVPDALKGEFSPGELFLLLAAIFLHDIGKTIPDPANPKKTWCRKEPNECRVLTRDNQPSCYKPQWDHFYKSKLIIETQGFALGLPDEWIAQYCGMLVFCHGLREPPIKKQSPFINKQTGEKCWKEWGKAGDYRTTSLASYGVIRIPLLASILRIADETDNSWTRALRNYWFNMQKDNPSNVGKAFRRCIEDIEFCHPGQCLILHIPEIKEIKNAPSLKKAYIKSINSVREEIDGVIKNWGTELNKIGVEFNEVYIEYQNNLYKDFDPDQLTPPPLVDVVGEKNKKSVEQIINAMVQLTLGSCGYSLFTWDALEAQVGRPLTAVDRWLSMRIGEISDNCILITEQNELRIEMTRQDVNKLKSRIVGGQVPNVKPR